MNNQAIHGFPGRDLFGKIPNTVRFSKYPLCYVFRIEPVSYFLTGIDNFLQIFKRDSKIKGFKNFFNKFCVF